MVEALASDGADDPFDERVLPRRLRGDQDLFDARKRDLAAEGLAVDGVPVSKEKAGFGSVSGKGLDDLLCGPLGGRMAGDVEVKDLPSAVGKDDEADEELEGHGGDDEEVAGRGDGEVVCEVGAPGLGRGLPGTGHVLGDGGLGDFDAELEKLAVDSRSTPEWIGEGHLADDATDSG